MKKQLRLLTAILLIFVTAFGMNIEASAAGTVIDTTLVRRADLLDTTNKWGSDCTGVQAMAVSRSSKNCLYSIKINDKELGAVMYYFPDISDWNTKVVFTIENVGHANGMTVDTDYIYICAKKDAGTKPIPNNQIIRISRNYIETKTNQFLNGEIGANDMVLSSTFGAANYTVMQPKIVQSVSNGVTTYKPYSKVFSTITRAESTGKFIIGTEIDGVNKYYYNGFVRAEIIDGEFVISSDPDDTFIVENSIVHKYASRQDVYYLKGYGLFIGRWYGGGVNSETSQYCNKTKNVILWADIDGEADTTNNGYKCYIPDKIKVDMTNIKEDNITVYEKFEIESMGITAKGNLIATFNVIYTKMYFDHYNAIHTTPLASEEEDGDGIYKITRADGGTFKLS